MGWRLHSEEGYEKVADTDTRIHSAKLSEPAESEVADEPEAPAQIKLTFDDNNTEKIASLPKS